MQSGGTKALIVGWGFTQEVEVSGCWSLLGAQGKPKNLQVLGIDAEAEIGDPKAPHLWSRDLGGGEAGTHSGPEPATLEPNIELRGYTSNHRSSSSESSLGSEAGAGCHSPCPQGHWSLGDKIAW